MHRIALYRIALCLTLTSLLCADAAPPFLFPIASANDESSAETDAINSREDALKRKEQELLRAIDLGSTTATTPHAAPAKALSNTTHIGEGEPGVLLEIKAPEETIVAEQVGQIQQPQPQTEKATALEELTHHPALSPPKKAPAVPPVVPNRVRTKSYDDFPDGTTAQRVGSFYRIDRGKENNSSIRMIAHARTVPLQDISPTMMGRPALLTSDELATIRNPATYLRTGPTRFDSNLLKVPQYTEVTIDYRSGTWYRVRTENGVRGWVPGSSLLFDAYISPHQTVRVGGVR